MPPVNPGSLDQLAERAAAGDSAAMAALGEQLLSGTAEAFDPMAGADWLARAAERGSAQADALLAVLTGAGVCRPQSWAGALTHLQRAAARGHVLAREQLALFAAEMGAGQPIDLERLTVAPAKTVLWEAPRLRAIERFASPAWCAWLMNRARDRLAPARIYDAASGAARLAESRTNLETDFNIVQTDLVLVVTRARIAAATGLPTAAMELTKVLHYGVGQHFAPHFDFLDEQAPGLAAEIAARGQRIATFLLYLNDGYEGGETAFPQLGLRHRGRCGDALLFANVDLAQRPDRQTLHAGLAPVRGQKWLLSQWIRNRAPA